MKILSMVKSFVQPSKNLLLSITLLYPVRYNHLGTNFILNNYWCLEFRFNLNGAILGKFRDVSDIGFEPPPCQLTHFDFIATRLLPCGQIDAPVQKFTGNNDEGGPPTAGEYLTVTLHAFTHYVAVFSRGNLLLCDLQGNL